MTDRLDRLAESHGIQLAYVSELGERRQIDDTAKRALLTALGVDPEGEALGSFDDTKDTPTRACALPPAVQAQRCWGVACQLYGLRSQRNLGIGDFEDLAVLADIAGAAGAAFVGVNPLHALFLADPGRHSPYSPSTRRFVNPLYIAIDQLEGGQQATAELRAESPALFKSLADDLVDYHGVAALKRQLLRRIHAARAGSYREQPAFQSFCADGGDALRAFALFEAISEHEVEAGRHAGWHTWSADLKDAGSEAVARFAVDHAALVDFHGWLQFEADTQLARAQTRARAAGMHIGLYLDLAVGVAPDGADTWIDPTLTVGAARVGAPPDLFNSLGQDWGLAPLSPKALAERDFRPLSESFAALTRHAGAVRIDHVMGLARLWWIPEGQVSSGGGYLRYPLGAMVDTVATVSEHNTCLVVGEDLGTVPPGFRHVMEAARILSYRVLYFERHGETAFLPPETYPQLALACISTHDLPTLAGWWNGVDIGLRIEAGTQSASAAERDQQDRRRAKRALVSALAEVALLPPGLERVATGEDEVPQGLSDDVAVAIHRFIAMTASLLVAVQLDDMIGLQRQPNLPGTTDQYPNWRCRSTVPLEDLAANHRFRDLAAAMRHERPNSS